MSKNIVIIGAGPSGLSAALRLAQTTKYNIEVFDVNNFVGGLAGSEEIDGMVFDYGPHIFHSKNEDVTLFWKTNFKDLLIEKEFFSKNYKDGILYDYPITWDSIEKFPEKIKNKVKKEISQLNPENLKRARNFKECVIELVGPTIQSIFFEKYTEKLWGVSPEKMSANWAPKRIELRKKQKSFWAGQYSACGKYGSGKIWERVGQKIKDNGGKIHLEKKLNSCEVKDNKILKLNFNEGEVHDVSNKIVISTIPLNRICNILKIPFDLMFNSVRLVFIVLSKDYCLPENVHSIYFCHDGCYFHRVTEQKRFSDIGYTKDKTLLAFEVSYTGKPHLGNMSDSMLVKEIFEQFVSLGFAEKKDFVKGFTRKLPDVNPVMTLGYEQELSIINSKISSYENLHLAGGSAEFTYGDVQSMVARGWDIADLLSSNHYEINKNLKVGSFFKFNEIVEIYNYKIGKKHPTILIAEIGLNHRGSFELAKTLIKEAKNCGCEIAKLQTYELNSRVSDKAYSAKYANRTLGMEESTNEMFNRFSLSKDELKDLFKYANDLNMPIISTPFDEKSVDYLIDLGVKAFKIASFDLVNIPFLRYVASKQLPMILSTGMSSMSEIEEAIEAIRKEKNNNLVLLHCVSAYPANISDVNLLSIETLRNTFKVPVGFSDHTVGLLSSTVALALKTDMVERHFTLDRNMEGPDHILSSDPEEMKDLVNIRNKVFLSLGDGIKKPMPVEIQQINKQRKSLYAMKNIKKGEKLTLENITIKGPGLGLLPKYLPLLLDKKVTREILKDTPIIFDDILSI